MTLRKRLEDWQIQWARRRQINVGPPPWNLASAATGYVSDLRENLFEPLSDRATAQFIAGAGGELDGPDGRTGNMYAVYSSSALCVNLFHPWSRVLDTNSPATIAPLLRACGLPSMPATQIEFEVPQVVNPAFFTAPHLDVRISFGEGGLKCAGIESKFCEPYGDKRLGGLNPCYLREIALWRDWPGLRAFAERISPVDRYHSHLHAAQLIIHLLGLRRQNGTNFAFVYLWFDVPDTEAANRLRHEVEEFAEIVRRDGIAFVARTYQQVFDSLLADSDATDTPHVRYLLERYSGIRIQPT